MYHVIQTEKTFCPHCKNPVMLLTDESKDNPQFYICHLCAYIGQVGKGLVTANIDMKALVESYLHDKPLKFTTKTEHVHAVSDFDYEICNYFIDGMILKFSVVNNSIRFNDKRYYVTDFELFKVDFEQFIAEIKQSNVLSFPKK